MSGLSQAQASLIGFGQVDDGGDLVSGYSAVGGTLSSTRIGLGHYEVDFVNPGAFAGADRGWVIDRERGGGAGGRLATRRMAAHQAAGGGGGDPRAARAAEPGEAGL